MYANRFPVLAIAVMITVVPACDNVAFEGIQVELRAPEPASPAVAVDPDADAGGDAEEPPAPIALGPLLYVVERTEGSRATVLPVAQVTADEYAPLPDTSEISDLVERFAVDRWEAGVEFALLAQGSRVGTFVSDGSTEADESTCQLRPRGAGHVEVRPDAAVLDRFLAVAVSDPDVREPWASIPRFREDAELRSASLNLAQRLIPELGVLWPPSIPAVRRDLQPFQLSERGSPALAVSYVYGDQLAIGRSNSRAYGLFILAAEGETRYEPLLTWHQRAAAGKAFPRFVGAHDARETGSPDVLVEVFGETDRWLALLGVRNGDWSVLYQDDCGQPPARGAIRNFR